MPCGRSGADGRGRMPGRKFAAAAYQLEALKMLCPPEQLTVSQWAERYRVVDSKSSAMPGAWSNSVAPYLTGIMDEFNNYETETVVFCKPTQVGGTEAAQNMVGYIVMQDPAPAMIVYPTEALAKSISENRLQPMLRAAPEIRRRFDENSSMLELQFDGMYLVLAGSNAPSGLASRPIRFLILDEVDKYPGASGREADPVKLAVERTKTFHNRKIYITSTPTVRSGHIWKAKEGADIERHYFVPCPHCGEFIELMFKNIRFPDGDALGYAERAEAAVYVCQECGCAITDGDKQRMLRLGEWRDVRRGRGRTGTVAFWINTLYSPFVRWAQIVKEFLTTKDSPEEFQNFVNSWLAEPWEDTKLKTDAGLVMERQSGLPALTVPAWAKLLTGGVDVQEASFYWTVRAWGDSLTSQNVAHGQALSFEEIDRVMNLEYRTEEGAPMVVSLCLVDSGDQTDMVYDFCTVHSDYALPSKGSSHGQLSHYKLSKINRAGSAAYGMNLVLVDTEKYKDMIAARMRKWNGRGSWMVYDGCDQEYAEQVTAEHKVNEKKGGATRQVWRPKRSHGDNHYLDAEVYAFAAADVLGARTMHLQDGEAQRRQGQAPAPDAGRTPEDEWIGSHEGWLSGGG